ncbi:hypothetical protein [Aquimarina celericrescens]|uniref:Uncharacterized protein n=1 Tax=Aquimarina celericrescens TaxID=1964542 RepID=A0ABW5ARS1_9FLAO|nr:hypothetical protein [Aquimarina celericrescens]
MNAKVSGWEEKAFYVKAYQDLCNIKKAINTIKQNIDSSTQLSVLCRVPTEINKDTTQKLLKAYREQLLGTSMEHGFFFNSQIGTIFIIGSLTSMFLRDMDGKVLGALSTAPYAILRGLGLEKETAQTYVNALKLGCWLLILRGFKDDLYILKGILN